jgi:5-methylthioadenosine/S-adenosylhomocysteine deaminase
MQTLIHGGAVVTANPRGDIIPDASILIDQSRIVSVGTEEPARSVHPPERVDARNLVVIPGFVQTHLHLCQVLFRGLADDLQLLDWLREKIFPMEAAHDEHSMFVSALIGIGELIRSGTTTILDMGSIRHEEQVIRAIGETGFRAFAGKAMMDVNDMFPGLRESTADSVRSTRELAERWHNSFDGRVRYAVAPRFVLSCTDTLMQDAYHLTCDHEGMLFHTHASENRVEIEHVRQRCGMENIEFLNHLGLMSHRTVLAHCVHTNPEETEMLRSTRTRVAHCPSSNLKLGSGVANIPEFLRQGIEVSLGTDGAPCNNTHDMFHEMRLASLLQKPVHGPTAMPARTVFELATIGGARALGLDREIGSVEAGKKADLVLLDLERGWNPVGRSGDDLYSSIVYTASPENVHSVMIDGKWVYRNRTFTGIDEQRVRADATLQLKNLLNRL